MSSYSKYRFTSSVSLPNGEIFKNRRGINIKRRSVRAGYRTSKLCRRHFMPILFQKQSDTVHLLLFLFFLNFKSNLKGLMANPNQRVTTPSFRRDYWRWRTEMRLQLQRRVLGRRTGLYARMDLVLPFCTETNTFIKTRAGIVKNISANPVFLKNIWKQSTFLRACGFSP